MMQKGNKSLPDTFSSHVLLSVTKYLNGPSYINLMHFSNPQFNQFMGDWYVLEYQYTTEMRLKDLSCVGFHFSQTGFGDIISNFTFR